METENQITFYSSISSEGSSVNCSSTLSSDCPTKATFSFFYFKYANTNGINVSAATAAAT